MNIFRRITNTHLQILLAAIPLSLFIFTGLWGLDFGHHWDENKMVPLLRETIRTGSLLPGWYRYPSVTYWLNLVGLLPYLLGLWFGNANPQAIRPYLIDVVGGDVFRMQVRAIFLLVASLSVIWVYVAVFVWRKRNHLEAFLGAALLASSWEVAYHSRWMAPDAILMQFGALTLCCSLLALNSRQHNRLWLWAAALAAGFGLGTKYPGGLLLLPVLIAAYRLLPRLGWLVLLESVLAFSLGFLASTPGAVLQPRIFLRDVLAEITHYASGHYGYALTPLEHFRLIGIYFARAAFSHYQMLALIVFALFLLGVYQVVKTSWADAALLLAFPFTYGLFFGFQRVMIVRNLLVVFPFLAVLASRGAGLLWQQLPKPAPRLIYAGFVASLLIINALWLVSAADSIRARGSDAYLQQFLRYAERHPGQQFWASPEIWSNVQALEGALPLNITPDDAVPQIDLQALYASESRVAPQDWPRNRPGLVTAVFGPREVNFDYYPTWAGDDRILLMPSDAAMGLLP